MIPIYIVSIMVSILRFVFGKILYKNGGYFKGKLHFIADWAWNFFWLMVDDVYFMRIFGIIYFEFGWRADLR